MADFCQQCSLTLFGKDFGGLAGLGEGKQLKPGDGFLCICEGCGPTIVDERGRCIADDCPEHGKDAAC